MVCRKPWLIVSLYLSVFFLSRCIAQRPLLPLLLLVQKRDVLLLAVLLVLLLLLKKQYASSYIHANTSPHMNILHSEKGRLQAQHARCSISELLLLLSLESSIHAYQQQH
jgi:hypothetical protein